MQVTFENVKWDGSVITAKGNHNCGEHLFSVRLEGADCIESEDFKIFTDPPEYAEKDFALRSSVSLLFEVLRTKQNYIDETGFIYANGR